MKTNLCIILLFLICGCTSRNSKQEKLHDLNSDFPVADTVSFESIQTMDIAEDIYHFMVKDSVLFVIESSFDNFGHCYKIGSGEKLSTLLSHGNAAHEMNSISFSDVCFWKDSIQFPSNDMTVIKTFAINDILTKPMGERQFSSLIRPDTIPSHYIKKIGDNEVMGSISFPMNGMCNNYFIDDGNVVSIFGDLSKEHFEPNADVEDLKLRKSFEPLFSLYKDKIVAANKNGIFLQIIDKNKKVIEKQRYYHKIKVKNTYNPNDYYVGDICCDDKFIYCGVAKRNDEKTKKKGKHISDKFILVFDWELKPIKKYHLGTFDLAANRFYFSEDGKLFYYMSVVEGEKQVLYKGKIE